MEIARIEGVTVLNLANSWHCVKLDIQLKLTCFATNWPTSSICVTLGAAIGAITGGLAGKGVAEGMNPIEGDAPEEYPVGTTLDVGGGALAGAAVGVVAGPVLAR